MSEKIRLLVVQDSSMLDSNIEQRIKFASQQIFNIIEVIIFNFVNDALVYLEYTKIDAIISGFHSEDLSGIDFLKLVRKDSKLSHIPFILLGDKISEEDIVNSFLLMANGFFTKPFNFNLIVAKIKGCIDYSKFLRNESEVQVASHLDSFLFQFTQKVHGYIDIAVDIDKICREMKISRSTLQRRIKNLTGNTVSEQINLIKTKHAKKIIQNTDYPLKIVAAMVGFSSISYFNSVYKKNEGETPLKSRVATTIDYSLLNHNN